MRWNFNENFLQARRKLLPHFHNNENNYRGGGRGERKGSGKFLIILVIPSPWRWGSKVIGIANERASGILFKSRFESHWFNCINSLRCFLCSSALPLQHRKSLAQRDEEDWDSWEFWRTDQGAQVVFNSALHFDFLRKEANLSTAAHLKILLALMKDSKAKTRVFRVPAHLSLSRHCFAGVKNFFVI